MRAIGIKTWVCGTCNWDLGWVIHNKQYLLTCINPQCVNCGHYFEPPTVELKEVASEGKARAS